MPCGGIVLVDQDDLPFVRSRCWRLHRSAPGKPPYCLDAQDRRLHRELLGAAEGQDVDHRNGDTLDCRRDNLRLCTRAENLRNRGKQKSNRSGFKGVSAHGGRFRATINLDGKQKYLGHFDTAELAALAYDAAAIRLHGDFARPNFPTKPSTKEAA